MHLQYVLRKHRCMDNKKADANVHRGADISSSSFTTRHGVAIARVSVH